LKLKPGQVLIHDFNCSKAELNQGENINTAWFASEVPISSSPADFYSLPGLILANEFCNTEVL